MIDAHMVTLSPMAMLVLNTSLLVMIGWALWRAEQNLTPHSDWLALALLGIFAVSGRVLLDPIPNSFIFSLYQSVEYGRPAAASITL